MQGGMYLGAAQAGTKEESGNLFLNFAGQCNHDAFMKLVDD